MNGILISIIVVFILILVWFWYMECNHPEVESIWIDEVISKSKTGDIILFKATDNTNSSKILCYYTHIGVIWNPPSAEGSVTTPQIFEAAGTRDMDLYDHENKAGIFLSDLKTRLSRYKGKLYYKELNKHVPSNLNLSFLEFINYAKDKMYYNYSVIWNGIKKGLYLETCGNATNCGEITMLSLIKLGILNNSKYNERGFHHLMWMSNLIEADNGYYYNLIKKIKISPFT